MSLDGLRKRIDAVDRRILRLLDLRFRYALGTGRFKREAQDAGREGEILRSVSGQAAGRLAGPDFAVRIYREILAESRKLQRLHAGEGRIRHEDRRSRRGKDGGLAGPGVGPRQRRRRL